MRIYTKTGDGGETGLLGGVRVGKDHPRIAACGALDELNAALGLARATDPPLQVAAILQRLQQELFDLGADVARAMPQETDKYGISSSEIGALEADIDTLDAQLPPLTQFILPGGAPAACHLHLARAFCRRAERAVVALTRIEQIPPLDLVYLNRLSDLLFVSARFANHARGTDEVVWQSK